MIIKVHLPAEDLATIDKAAKSDGRSRSSFIARAAVLAATKPSTTPKVERSCFTCRFVVRGDKAYCKIGRDETGVTPARVRLYEQESGVADSTDYMPTNRNIDCPGWAAKEKE